MRESRFTSIAITAADYDAGASIPMHEHDRPSVMWAINGRLEEEVDGRTLSCDPSTIVFRPAGARHSNRATSRSQVVIVELLSTFDFIESYPERPFAAGGVPAALAHRVTRALAGSTSLAQIDVEELVLEIVLGGAIRQRASRAVPRWLRRVRGRLDDEPCLNHSLSSLAGPSSVHPIYLARAFRAAFGCTVSEYLHSRRMDLAIEALTKTDEQIGRLATRLGYFDHAHFSKSFRRTIGLSPSSLRCEALVPAPELT